MSPEQLCSAEALVIELMQGDKAALFVAERIGAMALAGDTAGVTRMREIAAKLNVLMAASSRLRS